MADNLFDLVVTTKDANGQVAQNVMHYAFNVSGSFTTTFEAAGALISAWQTNALSTFLVLMPSHVTIVSISSKAIFPLGGFRAIVGIDAPGTWGGANDPASAAIAANVRLMGAVTTKAGHVYVPFVPDDALVGDIFSPSYISAMQAWMATAVATFVWTVGGAAVSCEIYNRKLHTYQHVQDATLVTKPTPIGRRLKPWLS